MTHIAIVVVAIRMSTFCLHMYFLFALFVIVVWRVLFVFILCGPTFNHIYVLVEKMDKANA